MPVTRAKTGALTPDSWSIKPAEDYIYELKLSYGLFHRIVRKRYEREISVSV